MKKKKKGEFVIQLKEFNEIGIEEWRKGYGLADWRELNYNYLNLLYSIKQMPFKIIDTENCIIPFLDTKQKKTKLDQLMNSFVEIFTNFFNIDLNENPILFLFMPIQNKLSDLEKKELFKNLYNFCNENWNNHKIMMFYEFNSFRNVILKNNIAHKIVSYNTQLLCSYQNMEEYFNSLSSNNRRNIKKSMSNFETSNLEFKQIDMNNYKERVQKLYENNCNKFDEIYEPKEFWENVLNLKNVEWHGVFSNETLIMFAGFWTEENCSILSMFGKDYDYEDIIRETKAYFYMNIKLIEIAMKKETKIIFNGYGASEIKKQFGYKILDYAVSLLN